MTTEQLKEILSGINAATMVFAVIIIITLVVLYLIGKWKIFEKAGESGWKCLIPFYSDYITYKLFWKTSYYWIFLGLSIAYGFFNGLSGTIPALAILSYLFNIATYIFVIMISYRISKSFGHGVGYCIGLILLSTIFTMILGFNDDEYCEIN